jgi:hypothetical protein
LLQVLAAASHTGQQQPLQPQLPAASPQQLPRSTSGLALAPPMPMPLTQLRPWPANAAMAAAPTLPANPQSIPSTWMHQPPLLLNISAAPSAGLPGIATASNADHAAAPDRSAASVQGGGSPSWRPPAGPSRRRCDLSPPFLIPPEAKRRRSGADAIYGVQQQQQATDSSAPPPQLAQQMAAAAATLAAAMAAGQGTQLPTGLQLASSPAAVMPPAIPQLASGLDFQAVLAAATAASNVGRATSGGPHRAAGSPVAGIGGTTGSGRHSNVHGYGMPVSAPEGMRRSDLVALYTSPQEQVGGTGAWRAALLLFLRSFQPAVAPTVLPAPSDPSPRLFLPAVRHAVLTLLCASCLRSFGCCPLCAMLRLSAPSPTRPTSFASTSPLRWRSCSSPLGQTWRRHTRRRQLLSRPTPAWVVAPPTHSCSSRSSQSWTTVTERGRCRCAAL